MYPAKSHPTGLSIFYITILPFPIEDHLPMDHSSHISRIFMLAYRKEVQGTLSVWSMVVSSSHNTQISFTGVEQIKRPRVDNFKLAL